MNDEKIYTIIKIKELEEQRDELNKQLLTVKHKDEFLGNRLKLRLLELQRIGNDISLSNCSMGNFTVAHTHLLTSQ